MNTQFQHMPQFILSSSIFGEPCGWCLEINRNSGDAEI